MASKRQLGGNLGHLKAILRPKRGQDLISRMDPGGMREAIFSSAGIGNRIKPCPSGRNPTQRAGLKAAAGFKPAERGPGGGLTATYCTQVGVRNEKCNTFHMKSRFHNEDGASWGPLGTSWRGSWGPLGASWGLLGAPRRSLGALLESRGGVLGPLGGFLGASWEPLGGIWGLPPELS